MPLKKKKGRRMSAKAQPRPDIILDAAFWIAKQSAWLFVYTGLFIFWLIKLGFLIIWEFCIGFVEGIRQGYREYKIVQNEATATKLEILSEDKLESNVISRSFPELHSTIGDKKGDLSPRDVWPNDPDPKQTSTDFNLDEVFSTSDNEADITGLSSTAVRQANGKKGDK